MFSGSCPNPGSGEQDTAPAPVLRRPRETQASDFAFGSAAEGKRRAVNHCKAVMYLCKNVLLYKCMYINSFFFFLQMRLCRQFQLFQNLCLYLKDSITNYT